jgi:hypothetical protein
MAESWATGDMAAANGVDLRQGLILVHFSAQPEPFLTLNTSLKRLNSNHPLQPRLKYYLNTPLIPLVPQEALTLS